MGRTSNSTATYLWEKITSDECRQLLDDDAIPNLLALCSGRLRERYVAPFANAHPFAVMPSACLLIETIEAYRKGWESSHDVWAPKCIYLPFFEREVGFEAFRRPDVVESFYYDVRCGIVHQGETRGGWALALDNSPTSVGDRLINAGEFLTNVDSALGRYVEELREEATGGQLWTHFKGKLRATAAHADQPSPTWSAPRPTWVRHECKA